MTTATKYHPARYTILATSKEKRHNAHRRIQTYNGWVAPYNGWGTVGWFLTMIGYLLAMVGWLLATVG